MTSKLLWLFLIFSTVSCGTIKVHDTEVCNVAGVLSAGVSCTRAVTGIQTEKTFEELHSKSLLLQEQQDIINKKNEEISAEHKNSMDELQK